MNSGGAANDKIVNDKIVNDKIVNNIPTHYLIKKETPKLKNMLELRQKNLDKQNQSGTKSIQQFDLSGTMSSKYTSGAGSMTYGGVVSSSVTMGGTQVLWTQDLLAAAGAETTTSLAVTHVAGVFTITGDLFNVNTAVINWINLRRP